VSLNFRGGSDASESLVQIQIVHRHGDRTPITPLNPYSYWSSLLPSEDIIAKMDRFIVLCRDETDDKSVHGAAGVGCYGKLTHLGLLQMVKLGSSIRSSLDECQSGGKKILSAVDADPVRNLRVVSTDFARTILSVQGVLAGLLGEEVVAPVDVDVRHTDFIIPDPQPRRSVEQIELEKVLQEELEGEKMGEENDEMQTLRLRLSSILYDHDIVDLKAMLNAGISFGVGEDLSDAEKNARYPVLQWGQLSEILKCLQIRDRLPPSVDAGIVSKVVSYTGGRWFRLLRNERLARLAVGPLARWIVWNACATAKRKSVGFDDDEENKLGSVHGMPISAAPLQLVSAHDSTLIGLLCVFQLEVPAEWPPYASTWRMELSYSEKAEAVHGENASLYDGFIVRFSLNGKILRCNIEEESNYEVSLQKLVKWIKSWKDEEV